MAHPTTTRIRMFRENGTR